MSRIFANPLAELIEYEEMNQELERGNGPLQVSGCMDSQKVHLIQETALSFPWKLVVTYDDSRAREIYEDFGCFRQDVWMYPAKDLLFYSADIHGNAFVDEGFEDLEGPIGKNASVKPAGIYYLSQDESTLGQLQTDKRILPERRGK